jgi:hypothetical protein
METNAFQTTHNDQILYESYKKHFQDKVLDIY